MGLHSDVQVTAPYRLWWCNTHTTCDILN